MFLLGAPADMIATGKRTACRVDRRACGEETEDEDSSDDDDAELPGIDDASFVASDTVFPARSKVLQLAGILQALSPADRDILIKTLGPLVTRAHTSTQELGGTPATTAVTTRKLFTSANENERSSDLFQVYSLKVPPAILMLAAARVHIPLTLTTTDAIRKMHHDPTAIKTKKVVTADGQRMYLLDVSAWPDEASLPPELFGQAWHNMLKVYTKIGDEVAERFRTHLDYLLALRDFVKDYKAILQFDCEVRRAYMNDPPGFFPKDPMYDIRFHSISLEILSENLRTDLQSRHDSSRRFTPYPRGGRGDSHVRMSEDRPRPFQVGRRATSSTPTCLICARTGHHAANCMHTSIRDGRPTMCVFVDRHLLVDATRQGLCVIWNLSGKCAAKRCPRGRPHSCSLCGSQDHHAGSAKCVRT
ncbi:uncharacterized protein LAESUDRAFT_212352 [Laetiporus sulphureus 93-53]|uniref:Uncharacterized protein n=1 Tax=Laetiporus sulphureus 93-53 TaxID=1314785 RepID=A0A165DVN5_9APHY|nr:uncharacterized protein LAESUDRAFT_212352 [Laetiporus sulphureus 93-53]KZT05721.1 hypothetical protein LAESUDRAFT_212352 [Laetiporus sulphureus 93-53]